VRGRSTEYIAPSAARLATSLRDIGYDFVSALADLVDNSISAGSSRIDIRMQFAGHESKIIISDDGRGMSAVGISEALRFGTRRNYHRGELGRFGLGLKTASLSQARSLTVCSRVSPSQNRVSARTLDLDEIIEYDDWLIFDPGNTSAVIESRRWLRESPGTVVIWEKLDRILTDNPESGWSRRRLESLATKTRAHLAMVFHRFIEGSAAGASVAITINGEKLEAWNPFALDERNSQELPLQRFEIPGVRESRTVSLRRFVLPARDRFSSPDEFERLSGPSKWNRQQGLYIFRSDRLVQWGGWAGFRAIDEHTKLARAALDFDTDSDEIFKVDVAKRRVSLPDELKQMLERPMQELAQQAGDAYRATSRPTTAPVNDDSKAEAVVLSDVSVALRAAAARSGQYSALKSILAQLQKDNPLIAAQLGD
jgi:hypothetical protein